MIKSMIEDRIKAWESIGMPALLERFVLRNGRQFKTRRRIGEKATAHECYKNSTDFVLSNDSAKYVEGFVIITTMPVMLINHAWVKIGRRAMDLTLEHRNYQYFGVEFETSVLCAEIARLDQYGILGGDVCYNTDLIFRVDPELREIVESIIGDRKK